MTRKAHLELHLSPEELKKHYRSTIDQVESRRWHLIWLVAQGKTIKEAASAIGYNYDYALEIVKNYNEKGAEALKNRHKGRKASSKKNALLCEAQLSELRESLKNPPADKGIWTGPKVADWIAKRTGREKVAPQRGWDYLKKFRYSLKVPRPSHHKGNKQEQEQFKHRLSERVKELQQQYPNAQIEVWSFDEHRLGLKPVLRFRLDTNRRKTHRHRQSSLRVALSLQFCPSKDWTD